jgi:hypothetical protein
VRKTRIQLVALPSKGKETVKKRRIHLCVLRLVLLLASPCWLLSSLPRPAPLAPNRYLLPSNL